MVFKSIRFLILAFIFLVSVSLGALAQNPIATTTAEKMKECYSLLKSKKTPYGAELKHCARSCRLGPNSNGAMIEQCNQAYNVYKKASGQAEEKVSPKKVALFQVEELIATFGIRSSGQLIKFKLLSEPAELNKRALKVCEFKLPVSQWHGDDRRFKAQFNSKIRDIRSQGKNVAYLLSKVSWPEDGLSNRYACQIEKVDVVAIL